MMEKNTSINNSTKKIMVYIIGVLITIAISCAGLFISWNYKQDANRDEKIEMLQKEKLDKNDKSIMMVRESIKEVKEDVKDVRSEIKEVKGILIGINKK